jgi:mannose-6-phosphate isomerase-like protein (cupin superfamily)
MRYTTLVSAIVLVLGSTALHAQRRTTGPATFAVYVSDPAGKPITGVKVTLDGPAQRSSTTESGRVAFENLPTGTYHVRFEHDAFETLDQDVVARGTKVIDVKVTLVPLPKPVPQPPPPPEPPPPANVKPVAIDMPSLIEKNYVGKASGKISPIACGSEGTATLVQINDPLSDQRHADGDEFLYVISGQGNASLAGVQEPLGPATFVMVPRGVPHTLTRTGRSPLVMLAVRAGEKCQ